MYKTALLRDIHVLCICGTRYSTVNTMKVRTQCCEDAVKTIYSISTAIKSFKIRIKHFI